MTSLKQLKDHLAQSLQEPGVNLTREEAYDKKVCVKCGGDATVWRDALSAREYRLTIWCQSCQDETFGTGEGKQP